MAPASRRRTADPLEGSEGRTALRGVGAVPAFYPRSTLLSDVTETRREATRPSAARDERFAAQFDDDTLFFDAFRSADGRHVVAVGPPLFNLASAFRGAVVRDAAGGPALRTRWRELDRHAQLWVEAPAGVTQIALDTGLGRFDIAVGDGHGGLFAGRRVLLTRSRNNPLPWILDWIRFNRDVNGADAVLFYDNASTLYPLDELRAAIGGVAGLRAAAVVHWPFKYGPQGLNATDHWDSDFCELGAWEHARWLFLQGARSVLTGDVDELAFGKQGVFEAAEGSRFGVVRYHGRWVVGLSDRGPNASIAGRRHLDYDTVLRAAPGRNRLGLPIDANRCAPKWTAVPARCPARAQWRMHTIKGWPASYLPQRDLGFGHFRPINTSWKYERDDVARFDPGLHERDEALAAAMAQVDWER